jgi:hypothetical protein
MDTEQQTTARCIISEKAYAIFWKELIINMVGRLMFMVSFLEKLG